MVDVNVVEIRWKYPSKIKSVNMLRFSLLLFNQLVIGIDAYSMAFLLLMELTSSAHTSFAGNFGIIGFALGEILLTLCAYVARDWFLLRWFFISYFALTLLYLYSVPESPYWLFSQKKYSQLESYLRKIASTNRRAESVWFPMYEKLIRESETNIDNRQVEIKTAEMKIIQYLPRLAMSSLLSFVTMLVYFKISFGLASMNKILNPYGNTIIGALVECIGTVTSGFLITTRLGRRYTLMIYSLCTSVCVLAIPFCISSYPTLSIIISQMGKLAISGALCIAWIYAPELFPTSMRGLANGVFVFFGRIGAILAPVIEAWVGSRYVMVTHVMYSILAAMMIIVVYLLPETRNRSFHDEQEDNDFKSTIYIDEEELTMLETVK